MVYLVQILYTFKCILTLSSHWYGEGDEASPSIICAGRALLVKMLITLEPHGKFGSNLVYLCILTLPSNCMQNGDEASSSIILAGQALLMKMFITLELHSMFSSNFVYYCILTLSNRWYAKR